jgi:UDP-4-amino-4,6-dideoxy-L-N-acetyl-beta-L-altrosamine transaminase
MLPYGKQHIDDDDIKAVTEALKSDYLTTGPRINEFEQKICEFSGAEYAVAVSNGTAALHLASLCLLKENDKVLTTPNSFLATTNSILYAGAVPVFIDICPDGNMDLDLCEQYLESNDIKAIYTVHFSGKAVNQDKLKYLKDKYAVKILEDCAHSIGAVFKDINGNEIKAGSCLYSECSIFSFHPVKHMTTGEGGAITTNDPEIYKKLLLLRNHGMTRESSDFSNNELAYDKNGRINPWYYEMQMLGFNYRLTDIQAALGISQFKKLAGFIEKRRKIARLYDTAFADLDFVKPLYCDQDSAYHLYILLIDFAKLAISRGELMKKLQESGIGTQVHYIPINKQPYYKNLGYGTEILPQMADYYDKCLSIPMYPDLKDEEITYIINQVKKNLV